jgi:hypothetical protein
VTPKVFRDFGVLTQGSGQAFLPAQAPSPKMAVLWEIFKMAPETA